MKKLLVAAILLSACGAGNNSKPTTTDTVKTPVVKTPEDSIITNSKRLGNLEIAGSDFPQQMIWEQAKAACEDLGKGWRLPTIEELNDIYLKKDSIGGFTNNLYWTSLEVDTLKVLTKNFANGKESSFSKIYTGNTRAVRSF
jgi:hypothetical protein